MRCLMVSVLMLTLMKLYRQARAWREPYQMMQASLARAANVHARSLPYGIQAL